MTSLLPSNSAWQFKMNSYSTIISSMVLAMTLFLFCGTASARSTMAPFDPAHAPATPDYAHSTSWIAFPANPDQFPVDIFWVYPTILSDNEHWLMDITSEPLLKKAKGTLVKQASVFSGQANLYAPLYRQMNMAALSLPPEEMNTLQNYGMEDVWNAFTYYLANLNNGRPFILAGHSQGSDILVELAKKHWGSIGAERNLVAAYTIGWSITHGDLKENPALTMCESAEQTNCFISYNSVAAGRQKAAPTITMDAVVVNPLTWTTDETVAPASLNLGARFFNDDGTTETIPHFASAQAIDSGLVVQAQDPGRIDCTSLGFPAGVYHFYDYSLFFDNLRDNVGKRIAAFLAHMQ